jgi:hypothetical protein
MCGPVSTYVLYSMYIIVKRTVVSPCARPSYIHTSFPTTAVDHRCSLISVGTQVLVSCRWREPNREWILLAGKKQRYGTCALLRLANRVNPLIPLLERADPTRRRRREEKRNSTTSPRRTTEHRAARFAHRSKLAGQLPRILAF